jgi:predicted Zn-dependent peptidase
MLEHCLFKGTEKRTWQEIQREMGFIGGNSNAFTSNEMVCYYISTPFENTEIAADLISDITFNSTIPEDEFLKEKEVVKEEELMYKEEVDSVMWDRFCLEFFSNNLSIPVIGTQETIDKFTRDEVYSFYKKFYGKEGIGVVLISPHEPEEAYAILNKYFGENDNTFSRNITLEQNIYPSAKLIHMTKPGLEQAHVQISYPGLNVGDSKLSALRILTCILGSGMDSRLFTEVREKHGLCYGIGAGSQQFRDAGIFMVHSSTREENVEKLIELVHDELNKIKIELVTDEELMRAKNKFRASFYSSCESSMGVARDLSSQIFNNREPIEVLMERLMAVTAEDVRLIANEIINEDFCVTLICTNEKAE